MSSPISNADLDEIERRAMPTSGSREERLEALPDGTRAVGRASVAGVIGHTSSADAPPLGPSVARVLVVVSLVSLFVFVVIPYVVLFVVLAGPAILGGIGGD